MAVTYCVRSLQSKNCETLSPWREPYLRTEDGGTAFTGNKVQILNGEEQISKAILEGTERDRRKEKEDSWSWEGTRRKEQSPK